MKYIRFAILICLAIMCCSCNNENAAPAASAQTQTPPAPVVHYQIDCQDPASIIAAYYQALFYNDFAMAYDFMYERDRWFMFPEDFTARYKLNKFAYPAYVADKFGYVTESVAMDGERAVVTGLLTLPQTGYISALLGERLFDVSLPPITDRELREMLEHENWQYVQHSVRHVLLKEDDRWYIFYDYETEENVAGLLRRACDLNASTKMSELLEAKDTYEQALALLPESGAAREGLKLAQQNIAALEAKSAYIDASLELFDFIAKAYRQTQPENKTAPGVVFKLRNSGDRALAKVVVRITFLNADGSIASQEQVEPLHDFSPAGQAGQLLPGAVWEFKQPAFYMTVSPVQNWQQGWQKGNAKAEVIDIEFVE